MSTTPPPTPPAPPVPPTPSAAPPAAAATAPPAPPAKKSNALLWVLGGCGTIIVLGIVVVAAIGFFVASKVDSIKKNPVLAAAKLSVAMNPDLETVSSDDSTGTIVVRDRKTNKTSTMRIDPEKKILVVTDDEGKTVTMKLDPSTNRLVVTDAQGKTATITANTEAGNLEVKGPEGTVKIGNNSDKAPDWVPTYPGSSPQSTMSINANGNQGGTYVFVTQDTPDKVLTYFGDALKSSGLSASTTSNNTDGKVSGIVTAADQDHKRSVVVTVSPETDGVHVSVTFEDKKTAN